MRWPPGSQGDLLLGVDADAEVDGHPEGEADDDDHDGRPYHEVQVGQVPENRCCSLNDETIEFHKVRTRVSKHVRKMRNSGGCTCFVYLRPKKFAYEENMRLY